MPKKYKGLNETKGKNLFLLQSNRVDDEECEEKIEQDNFMSLLTQLLESKKQSSQDDITINSLTKSSSKIKIFSPKSTDSLKASNKSSKTPGNNGSKNISPYIQQIPEH